MTTVNLYNSIIHGNSPDDCAGALAAHAGNLVGSPVSSCQAASLSSDPLLSATPTGSPAYLPLLENSPAIDAAVTAQCTEFDQRGDESGRRLQAGTTQPHLGAGCDIDAYEGAVAAPVQEIEEVEEELGPVVVEIPVVEPDSDTLRTIAGTRNRGEGGPESSSSEDQSETAPTPAPSTCETLHDSILVSGYSPSTQCQRIDAVGVGVQSVIDLGVVNAVDVWGYVGGNDVEVCFSQSGAAVLFQDSATTPPVVTQLAQYSNGDRICATIDRPGQVVLVANSPQGQFPQQPASEPTATPQDCMVTLLVLLNFRETPNGEIIMTLPASVTLTVVDSAPDWYKVDWYGRQGWVSADYVTANEDCG